MLRGSCNMLVLQLQQTSLLITSLLNTLCVSVERPKQDMFALTGAQVGQEVKLSSNLDTKLAPAAIQNMAIIACPLLHEHSPARPS